MASESITALAYRERPIVVVAQPDRHEPQSQRRGPGGFLAEWLNILMTSGHCYTSAPFYGWRRDPLRSWIAVSDRVQVL